MSKYIECEQLELKEKLNEKFVREVVAFLNSDGGKIIIGVKDNGEVLGVDNIDETLKNISDIVYNQIEPECLDCIKTEIVMDLGKVLISVNVSKGKKSLYCIKKYGYSSSGCLIRVGSTVRSMSEENISNRYKQRFYNCDMLIEAETNLNKLSFHSLKQFYLDKGYRLNDDNFETNLSLINQKGKYNLMAELLSDDNRYSLIFVKFNGINKASLSQRTDYGKRSLLFAYEQLKNRIASENICLSDTKIRPRVDKFLFDFDCVNEAIINAIVHNDWTIAEPQITFYSDRLEILSHGGLPNGLSKQQFFRGISRPRNMKLMKVFSDLDIVEHTGHGVVTIVERYGKEAFEINDDYLIVTIPFDKSLLNRLGNNINEEDDDYIELNSLQKKIMVSLQQNSKLTMKQLAQITEKSVRTIERNMSILTKQGYISHVGPNKNGTWIVNK